MLVASWRSLAFAALALPSATLADDDGAQIGQVAPDAQPVAILCLACVDYENAGEDEEHRFVGSVSAGPANTLQTYQSGDGNIAASVSLGSGNSITQVQYGFDNTSLVGVVADDASVAVVQVGDHREAEMLVLGTPTSPIGVFQGPDSPAVHAAILTDASGRTLIAPGNATVVIAPR